VEDETLEISITGEDKEKNLIKAEIKFGIELC
jgi:hypothetical protein